MYLTINNEKKIKFLILIILIFDFISIILGLINKSQFLTIMTSNTFLLIFFIIFKKTKNFDFKKKLILAITIIFLFPLINPLFFNITMKSNFFFFYLIPHTLISNIIFLSFFQIYYDFTYELKNYISIKKKYITILCFLLTLLICYLHIIQSNTIYNNHNIFKFIYYFFLKLTSNVIVEEIFFRVILLSTLYNFFKKRDYNQKKSILFSILLTFIIWALLHNLGLKSITWYIFAICLHILFSLNYIYNKNFLLNMVLHALINLSYFIKFETYLWCKYKYCENFYIYSFIYHITERGNY